MREYNTRTRLAVGAAAVAGVLLLAGCLTANQNKLFTMVNDARTAHGKAKVTADQPTTNKAQAWAQHMADTGVVEHTGGGSTIDTSGIPKWCAVAENVGVGSSTQAVFNTWMASTVHKGNILGNYNKVGVGIVRTGDKVYATLIFYRSC